MCAGRAPDPAWRSITGRGRAGTPAATETSSYSSELSQSGWPSWPEEGGGIVLGWGGGYDLEYPVFQVVSLASSERIIPHSFQDFHPSATNDLGSGFDSHPNLAFTVEDPFGVANSFPFETEFPVQNGCTPPKVAVGIGNV